MRSLLHLNSFQVYNLLLIVFFSIIVNDNNSFSLIYSSFYCTFHFFLIYLGLYYYRKLLYLIYFLYGLGLDLLWLNEIGPHLLVFMFILVFFNLTSKHLYNLNSFKIYIVLLILQLFMISIEIFFSYLLFGFNFDLTYLFQIIILSLILSFPIFLIFSKIDQLK